jgi:hypothetical protein
MQGKWNEWEHSAVNTAAPPPFLTLRVHTPHRACKQNPLINHITKKGKSIKSSIGIRKPGKDGFFWAVAVG